MALWIGLAAISAPVSGQGETRPAAFTLPRQNLEAPFPYLHGGARSWPVWQGQPPPGAFVQLTATNKGELLARGFLRLEFAGLEVSLSEHGLLRVVSRSDAPAVRFQLEIAVRFPDGRSISQEIEVRPAPPGRPISYISDFSSEVIRLLDSNEVGADLQVPPKSIDQWFRRLQAHGVSRVIIWLSPFPFINEPANYAPADWARYERQTRAILKSDALDRILKQHAAAHWNWVRRCLALRLRSDFGRLLSDSAVRHGIGLTLSFRPFESAVSTYWEVPTFDCDGRFLWGFLPFASPAMNYHPERVGFAHFRSVLETMGKPQSGRLGSITLNAGNGPAFVRRFKTHRDNVRIVASHLPPFQEDSLVLQQDAAGEFVLVEYGRIADSTGAHDFVVENFELALNASGRPVISGLSVPDEYRFLTISNPLDTAEAVELNTRQPVTLRAAPGHRLGRANVYWALDDTPEHRRLTRQAGIPADGQWHHGREATRASWEALREAPAELPLRNRTVVIDRGAPWSVELLDLQQPEARARVLAEIRTVLAYPAFDEIFINTRSHTDLAGGLHYAYAPRSTATQPALVDAASDPAQIEQITVGPEHEWQGSCQSPSCSSPWRYSLNRAIAAGVRKLLDDLLEALPATRTRVVVLPREPAVEAIQKALETMKRPGGEVYGRDYYWSIVPVWNHHTALGEAMAMLDLTGLSAEPVFLGIHILPERGPLDEYLRDCLADMRGNRGSRFTGLRSIFYEAHRTLQDNDPASRQRREEIICQLLSHREDIGEVILYESAAWTYRLPLSDLDLCGHGFLDRCQEILGASRSLSPED